MTLTKTAFHEIHKSLGAKMVEFAGFEMPIHYSGIIEEHRRVRETVGVFDVSHMGEIEIWGDDALEYVQKITVNDASKLTKGRVQYSAMCYPDGGIVDDLLVYHLGDHYMLVVNAANIDKDFTWMRENLFGEVELKNRSDDFSLLAVQGPRSLETLQSLTKLRLSDVLYYHFVTGDLAGIPNMIVSRTGYTGELGFELYFPSDPATGKQVWDAIMKAGKKFDIAPIGLGARDTLRLEMGFCLYGNDIDTTTNTLEAGLGWITKLDKRAFNGKESMARAKRGGLQRKLVGFTLKEKAFPRHGYPIKSQDKEIGTVTSGTFSPILDKGIGMGYVPIRYAKPGTTVTVAIRANDYQATVVPLPFIKK